MKLYRVGGPKKLYCFEAVLLVNFSTEELTFERFDDVNYIYKGRAQDFLNGRARAEIFINSGQ